MITISERHTKTRGRGKRHNTRVVTLLKSHATRHMLQRHTHSMHTDITSTTGQHHVARTTDFVPWSPPALGACTLQTGIRGAQRAQGKRKVSALNKCATTAVRQEQQGATPRKEDHGTHTNSGLTPARTSTPRHSPPSTPTHTSTPQAHPGTPQCTLRHHIPACPSPCGPHWAHYRCWWRQLRVPRLWRRSVTAPPWMPPGPDLTLTETRWSQWRRLQEAGHPRWMQQHPPPSLLSTGNQCR